MLWQGYSSQLQLTKLIENKQGICEKIVRIKYILIFEEFFFLNVNFRETTIKSKHFHSES